MRPFAAVAGLWFRVEVMVALDIPDADPGSGQEIQLGVRSHLNLSWFWHLPSPTVIRQRNRIDDIIRVNAALSRSFYHHPIPVWPHSHDM